MSVISGQNLFELPQSLIRSNICKHVKKREGVQLQCFYCMLVDLFWTTYTLTTAAVFFIKSTEAGHSSWYLHFMALNVQTVQQIKTSLSLMIRKLQPSRTVKTVGCTLWSKWSPPESRSLPRLWHERRSSRSDTSCRASLRACPSRCRRECAPVGSHLSAAGVWNGKTRVKDGRSHVL